MKPRIAALLPHMRDAVANIAKRLSQTDVVVELRDARLPFSSENYVISDLIAKRGKRLLLLSKADLANPMLRQDTIKALSSSTCKVMYISNEDKACAEQVLSTVQHWLPSKRHLGSVGVMMILGTPNIGKTTLLNAIKLHAFKRGMLTANRATKRDAGPLPGVTKHVAGVQISDDPAILLVDTPGIMLPKMKESTFAYRAALAGLVDEKRVNLRNLFAFTLYVLGNEPNVSQLKMVLSRPLPGSHEPGPSNGVVKQRRPVRKPTGSSASQSLAAVSRRHAGGARRVAKCIMQSLSDIAELRQQVIRDMATRGHVATELASTDGSVWPAAALSESLHNSGLGHCDLQQVVPGEFSKNRATEEASCAAVASGLHFGGMPSEGHPALQPKVGPRSAAHFLRMMQAGATFTPPPAEAVQVQDGAQHIAGLVAGLVEDAPAQVDAAGSLHKRPDRKSVEPLVGNSSHTECRESGKRGMRASAWEWEPFNTGLWQECGDCVVRRLLKTEGNALEVQVSQVNSAMERVIRLTRSGALGKLLFEGGPPSLRSRGQQR